RTGAGLGLLSLAAAAPEDALCDGIVGRSDALRGVLGGRATRTHSRDSESQPVGAVRTARRRGAPRHQPQHAPVSHAEARYRAPDAERVSATIAECDLVPANTRSGGVFEIHGAPRLRTSCSE